MKILILTELFVLRRRAVGRAMLWVCTGLPVAVAILYGQLSSSDMTFNEKPVSALLAFSGPDATQVALRALHTLVPLFILALAGQSWAGERSSHVLREHWVRPVSRSTVLWAKILSLWAMALLSLAGVTCLSLLVTTPWLGSDGPWAELAVSFLMSAPCLLGLTLLASCVAQFGRSTASVIVGGLLFLGIDLGMRLGLSALDFVGVSWAGPLKSGLFGEAVSQWSTAVDGVSLGPVVSLVAWLAVLTLVTWRRVDRMEVP